MSEYEIVSSKGKVEVDNNLGCGIIVGSDNRRESMYERTKRQVYATGNKWAIENFHATHD